MPNIFRRIFGRFKRTEHPTADSSGQSTPDLRSSDQPTPGPRTGGQSTPNLPHITHQYGSQPLSQATGGGHSGPYSSIQPNPKPRRGQHTPKLSPRDQTNRYPRYGGKNTPDPHSFDQSIVDPYPGGQRNFELTTSGQRARYPRSSGQRTPDSRPSGQPTSGSRSSVQPTPSQQYITDPYTSGQSIFERTSSGQSAPDLRSSGQRTPGSRPSGQPTLGSHSSVQTTPNQQYVIDPYSGGQPINNGTYIITNVKHGTLVFLPDPNHRTPLQGHFRRQIFGELWRVEERVKQRYLIQSVGHKSFANSGPRAQVGDSVEGDSKEQLWRIQECSEGKFTISTTDTKVCWTLPQEEPETPVELSTAHADPKCWWTFTKLADDGHAALGQINHPTTIEDIRDENERQREDSIRATKSTRDNDFHMLQRLKAVDAPSYREDHGCMEGTRTALLDHLIAWTLKPISQDSLTNGSNTANMYWLYGSPGLGKTSIANSLCDRLHGSRTLGGSFFCRRDDPVMREPRRILPTLISKLAEMWDPYRKLVVHALRDDPQLNPESKRGEVLFSLLQSVQIPPPHTLVLVIDALDECGDPGTRKSLLTCLLEACSRVSWIKLFITSRPEHDIKTFFERNRISIRDLAEDDQTPEDIRLFTRQRMSRIARSHYLPAEWPGEGRIKQIIDRSGGLFIFVETVCRLVDDPDPDPRLAEVLDGKLVEANAELHKLYSMAILSRIGKSQEKFRSFAQAVVVVAAYRPLPEETLASLVGLDLRLVRSWLDGLGSILYRDPSTNGGIRVRHLSVIDFLTSPACPKEFRVVLGQANEEMAVRCLVTMARELKFNICELETSCVLNADIPDLNNRVQDKVSDALQYSSMHWASHLCSDLAPTSIAISRLLDAFLGGTQQLYWVEVMSLMGRVPVAISSMRLMKARLKKFEDRHRHVIEDALRFLLAFVAPISTSTPHIYVSALPFTPMESCLWRHTSISFPEMIDVCKGRAESWPAPSSIWLGHTGPVRSIAYSPDGQNVVSRSNDKTIRIWDVQTGSAVGQPLRGYKGWFHSVAYSPDGRNIVTGSDGNTIQIWDVQTGAEVGLPLTGHTQVVNSVAYSPNGRNVVSGSHDNTIRIWDAQTGAAMCQPLTGHIDYIRSVAYSPDGRNIVSSSDDHTIRIWDAQTGAAVGRPLTGHTGWVISVAYSPDGQSVVSGSYDKTIRIWDVQTGVEVGQPLRGHTSVISSVTYSPDGRNVVSGSYDQTIRIWDAQTGATVVQPLTGHTGHVQSVAYSPDGQNVVSGSTDSTIRIWDAQTGAPLGVPPTGHTVDFLSVAYSPDGQNVVSGSNDNKIRIWDVHTEAPVGQPLTGHTGWVYSVAYSPDGRNIVSGSEDKTIRIWDSQTGAPVGRPLTGHTDYVRSIAYSPDGRNVASGSYDNTIRIWDVQTGTAVGQPLTGHTGWVFSIAYSPDGWNIISGSYDQTIRIWDAQTGAAVGQPLIGHTDAIVSVAYSPDGRNIVSGSDDKMIRIWDSQTGAVVGQPLTGHSSDVVSVAYSPNGRNIVSGSSDQTIRIWDAQTGAAVGQPLVGHTKRVRRVVYSPDGRTVVSSSSDNTIRIWDVHAAMDEGRYSAGSHSSYPFTSHLSLTAFSGGHIPRTWLGPDGWVRGAEGLLFWVPEDCRYGLTCPAITTIPNTGRQRPVRIDFTRFNYGTSWKNIRGAIRESNHRSGLSF